MSTPKAFGPGRSVAENQEASFANRVENWMRAKVAREGLPVGHPTLYHLYVDAHYPDPCNRPCEDGDAFYTINDVAMLVTRWAKNRASNGDAGPASLVDAMPWENGEPTNGAEAQWNGARYVRVPKDKRKGGK